MTIAKLQKSKDIQLANRIIGILKPYLMLECEISTFVLHRTLAQIEEMKDDGLRFATLSFYYFCIGDTKSGTEYAEDALKLSPTDVVTWRNYALCMFWRVSTIKALDIAKRSVSATKSPKLAYEGCHFAILSADYAYFLEIRDFLVRTEMYDELVRSDVEDNMKRGLIQAELAKKHQKFETLKSLCSLMYERLSLSQVQDARNSLTEISGDDDEPTLLYEMYIPDSSTEECAAMNIALISDRVKKGLTDWAVGGLFVNLDGEIEDSASDSK